jgi:hypothetical protein
VTRARIAGAALLVLSAGLLIRVTKRAGMPSGKPASVPLEIRAEGTETETVDLRNGNLHVKIPIRAARQKTAAPLSNH